MFSEIEIKEVANSFRDYISRCNSGDLEGGSPDYAVDYRDIAAYADCPARWACLAVSDAELLDTADLAVALAVAAPEGFKKTYAIPPAFVEDPVLACPGCATVGKARRCAKCGLTRKRECHSRPFSATSKAGRLWKEQALRTGRHPLSQARASRTTGCANSLRSDTAVAAIAAKAKALQEITAYFHHPEEASRKIRVRALVTFLPEPWSEQEGGILAALTCMTAHPAAFANAAYRRGLHIRAALELDLCNAAGLGPRNHYFIAAAEWDPPHVIARREITPAAISSGRTVYTSALANLIVSREKHFYPDYDYGRAGELAWSQVDPEDALHNQSLALVCPPIDLEGKAVPIAAV